MLFSPLEVLEGILDERKDEAKRIDAEIERHRTAITNLERQKVDLFERFDEYRAAIKRLSDNG